uniref:WAS/WASL interacting protein family member 2 n=1 Tax=Taeniopygia guttata TaxID=59729 RepID=A0A674H2G7_TAEGU
MWLPVLAGSILAPCGAAALGLGDVLDRSCSWDPLWCRGTCAQCGLGACGAGAAPGWTVSRGAAGLAGPCPAAGGGMRNADVRSEQEIAGVGASLGHGLARQLAWNAPGDVPGLPRECRADPAVPAAPPPPPPMLRNGGRDAPPPPPPYRLHGPTEPPSRGKPPPPPTRTPAGPPPPPPPVRNGHRDSISTVRAFLDDFESKYSFHPVEDFPAPEEYKYFQRIYPSKTNRATRGAPPLPPIPR